jgi:hypothetical protein
MKIKINSKDLQKLVKDATREIRKIPREAHKYFKQITPRRNGYAQRNTVLINNQIQANYDYAGALDDGKSRQAPKGMSEPTIEQMEKEFVPNAVERINRG